MDFDAFIKKCKEKKLTIEEMVAEAYHLGYAEKVGGYGAYVVEKPQPPYLWVLTFKEHGLRRVAFSFDGPPSPAYVKMGRVE